MRIKLDSKCVRKGKRLSPTGCPWALACRSAMKPPKTSKLAVYPGVIAVWHEDGSQDQYRLPPLPTRQLLQYDAGMRMTLNDFDIDPNERVTFDAPAKEGEGVFRGRENYGRMVGAE